jgi:hypothetical protein
LLKDTTAFPASEGSGNSQLWGQPRRKGEWVDLELPVAADGKYRLLVYLTKARDYGIVQFHLNGRPLGQEIDCFGATSVVRTGAIELGTADLKKGSATLRLEMVGTNDHSVGLRYLFGLDYVVLKPAAE